MNLTLQPPPKHELAPYKALENQELQTRIEAARNVLGDQLLILGTLLLPFSKRVPPRLAVGYPSRAVLCARLPTALA